MHTKRTTRGLFDITRITSPKLILALQSNANIKHCANNTCDIKIPYNNLILALSDTITVEKMEKREFRI